MKKENLNLGIEVGQTIDVDKIVCREFDIRENFNFILRHGAIPMSWGLHAPRIMKQNQCYRFMVAGHHHKGHVYIALNFMDTFDIYLTSSKGKIKKVLNGIYIDQLIEVIDNAVEKIPDYAF
jgi:hypothetical protein